MSLFWDHMPHPTLGVRNIPLVTGDDVDMDMEDTLPGRRADINADIVTIRLEFLVQSHALLGDQLHTGIDLFWKQVEKAGHMAPRNDQGVPGTRRIGIASTVSQFALQ